MEREFCMDCNAQTLTVVDYKSGDTICTECGLVLESHYIDETSEWRTFADESDGADPNRVGARSNPLLSNSNLTTHISIPINGGASAQNLVSSSKTLLKNTESIPEKRLITAFEIISAMADKLGLNQPIKIRASEMFKKLEESKSCKLRNTEALCAGCLYMACKEARLSRTLKEICSVTEGNTAPKDVNRACGFIKDAVGTEEGKIMVDSGELVRRFCSSLRMSNQGIKAVLEAVQRSENIDIRRTPKSVLAAIIYMILQLSNEKTALKDISMTAKVAEVTIKKSYKDLYPHASSLVPSWYANQQAIRRLCRP